jgi:uncharacterized DUF497 family protein
MTWDETKRTVNLVKHGLDFRDASFVLASPIRMDVDVIRAGESRVMSMAYVIEVLAVLVLVHLRRDACCRITSFRRASCVEAEAYYARLGE